MLLSDEVQVGLSRTIVHPDIEARHIYDEHVVLVTHPSHPFAQSGEASIYDVAHEPLILYDRESSYFVLINRVVRDAGIVPNVQMDLDSIDATKRMIERGLGISFLPRNSLRRELEARTLATVRHKRGPRRCAPDLRHGKTGSRAWGDSADVPRPPSEHIRSQMKPGRRHLRPLLQPRPSLSYPPGPEMKRCVASGGPSL